MAVMLSVMVLGAGAAFSDQADIENTEAVNMCSALNIIGGYEDGSFHPERNIKRSEITKMICVALNGGQEPNVGTNEIPTFTDVRGTSAAWAEGYIESCVAQGIVSGVGGGRFAPDGNVTGSQLAKMLLVALGYNSDNEGFTGNAWETNVNVRAAQKGLYTGLSTLDTSAAVTRDQAAQMVWNALNAYEVEYKTNLVTDANGNLVTQITVQDKVVGTTNDKITLLEDKYEAKTFTGTFEGTSENLSGLKDGQIRVSGTNNNTTNPAPVSAAFTSDLSLSYIGEEVSILYKDSSTSGTKYQPDDKDEIYGVVVTGNTTVYNITKGDLQDAGTDNLNKGKIKFNDTLYDVANLAVKNSSGAFIYDTTYEAIVTNYGGNAAVTNTTIGSGDQATAAEFATYINTNLRVNSADTIKFVCNDAGEIVRAYVEQWTYTKLLSKTSDKIQLEGIGSRDLEDVEFDGNIEVGSLVAMADFYAGSTKTQIKAASTVSGKVTATRGNNEIQIGDTWYDVSTNKETLSDYGPQTYTVGDEFEIVLDGPYYVAGKVVKAATDYAVVLDKDDGINDQVKLLLADGTEKVFIINSDSVLQESDITEDDMVKYELLKDGTEVKMSSVSEMTDATGSATHTFDKDTKVFKAYDDPETTYVTYVASSNAVAFVKNDDTGKWKAFSANTISNVTAKDQTKAQYVVDDNKVEAFALVVEDAFPTGAGDATGYGYVTDVVYTKDSGDNNVVNLTVWTGSGDATVVIDGSTTSVVEGDFVKYPISSAAVANSDVVKTSSGNFTFSPVKVKEYDTSRNLVITTAGTYSVSGTIVGDTESVYKVDSNTQIIGVKTADKEGSDYNTITPFTKVSGSDFQNAYIISEKDNGTQVIKAIFVDEDNKLLDNTGAAFGGAAGAAFNVTAATVTAGTSASPVKGAYITVTTDKTQIITGETVTYKVTIHGDVTGGGTVTMTPGANASAGATCIITGDTTNVAATSGTVATITGTEGDGTVITFTVTGTGAVASTFALA
ncbi:MAG TPA: S-layer homology domain-containing protein [Candidatus Evtepia faecigallinarum]|nr:S-layer homology domain-containing protein [Candidatus Evtepia faecigallinarum]